MNKDGQRRDGVTVSETAGNCKTLSRKINSLRVHDSVPTDAEMSTIKTVYEIPTGFEYDSTSFMDKQLSLILKNPDGQAAKKARTAAMFIDRTLSLLKL